MASDYRVPRGTGDDAPNYAAREQAIWGRLRDQGPKPDFIDGSWQTLTPGQRATIATVELDYEVGHGGFEYYFSYHGVEWDHASREGMRLLRAREHLALFDKACRCFPAGEPPDELVGGRDKLLIEAVEEANDLFHALCAYSSEWYALENSGPPLGKLRLAYIDAHPEEFFL